MFKKYYALMLLSITLSDSSNNVKIKLLNLGTNTGATINAQKEVIKSHYNNGTLPDTSNGAHVSLISKATDDVEIKQITAVDNSNKISMISIEIKANYVGLVGVKFLIIPQVEKNQFLGYKVITNADDIISLYYLFKPTDYNTTSLVSYKFKESLHSSFSNAIFVDFNSSLSSLNPGTLINYNLIPNDLIALSAS